MKAKNMLQFSEKEDEFEKLNQKYIKLLRNEEQLKNVNSDKDKENKDLKTKRKENIIHFIYLNI